MKNALKSGYAPVNGLNMYYEIHGDGNMPLVLIHGGGSTIETSFSNILHLLSAHYKVIAVELQAHGRTNDRTAPESFEQDADDVATLLKYLNIGKANFFGFSNGGTTTLQIAIRHSGVVNKIITLAAAYRRDGFFDGFFDGFENASLDSMPGPLKTAFLAVNPDENALLNMFNRDVERMKNFTDIPDSDILAINASALIIAGDKDVMSTEHTVNIARLIPGAQLAILPGIHGECIGEICTAKPGSKMPEITVMLIREFLNG
ncbi:alpha/beta hydrolase [Mucilaginibacter sp. HMF5004]|uniref:alpha/beta fold hydrolase n=1 Tax=Mucilaginibacter rivuli TaxID=2857527 RepID=UPI001C5F5BB6|nr:alpha/beta hydrolase [Mucilaginibacter rivuli]MBW4889813.1 alpha/beta hydrolase [Mucilaginibacter rivuli]